MDQRRSSAISWGILLIVLGAVLLAVQVFGWPEWLNIEQSWPLIIIGVGILLGIIGLIGGAPGMAVPACIVGGIGLLLYYQNATGNWESWAYAWALIPGFAGVGTLLAGLLSGKRGDINAGLWLIVISACLFAVFGSFLGPLDENSIVRFWPVLLIVLGLLMLVQYRRGESDRGPATLEEVTKE